MPRQIVHLGINAVDAAGKPLAGIRFSERRLLRSLRRILRENVLCAIATVGGDGRAHINTAYFSFSSVAGSASAEYRLYRFVASSLKLLDEAEFGDGTFVTASVRRSPG
jgi:hypothetical protein